MGAVIHDRSQEEKILQMLESQSGDGWVPAPELARVALQYCRAISGLRKAGHRIENRVETVDGIRHGFYRLARPVVQVPLIPEFEVARRWSDPEEGTQRI
jgi:hypothetical protein